MKDKNLLVIVLLSLLFVSLFIGSFWNDYTTTSIRYEEKYYCDIGTVCIEVDEYRVSSMFTSYYILDGNRHDYSDVLNCKTEVTTHIITKENYGIRSMIKILWEKIF